jgi:hypothetical protein
MPKIMREAVERAQRGDSASTRPIGSPGASEGTPALAARNGGGGGSGGSKTLEGPTDPNDPDSTSRRDSHRYRRMLELFLEFELGRIATTLLLAAGGFVVGMQDPLSGAGILTLSAAI